MKESTEINEIFRLANEEAHCRALKEIDIDMLLLGLFGVTCGANLIIDKKTNHEILKNAVIDRRSEEETGETTLNTDQLPLSEEVGKIRGNLIFEYRNMDISEEPNSVHLLLSILSSKNSNAAKFFEKHDITYEYVRDIAIEKPTDPDTESTNPTSKSFNKKKAKSLLEEYGRNLNQLAIEGKIKPTIAREYEIERCLQILSCKDKNTPVLTGEPGVGKTAIAEGIAYNIVNKLTSPLMFDKIIMELSIKDIVAGTKYRGQFEDRMKLIIKTAKEDPNVILFMDEFHTAIGAGNQESGLDVANILKPALARGDIKCITATTVDEFRKIQKDAALDRRLQEVKVDEPSLGDTLKILDRTKEFYGKFHNVTYSMESIEACVELSDKFITNRFFPDKAFDLLDNSGAIKKLQGKVFDERIVEIDSRMEKIKNEKAAFVNEQNFVAAQLLKDEEISLQAERVTRLNNNDIKLVINKKDIEYAVSTITNIPVVDISRSESERINHVDSMLKQKIIGQDEAIKIVVDCIKKHSTGIKDPNKPIGSFIFLGKTGVGKTELAKQIGKHYFSNKNSFIRFDMSEYMEKHSVSKLIGAPPGYVGYEEGGELTEAVRRTPYCLILFDEIEKAHPDVYNILLQVLDEGVLTDSLGRKTYFKNSIIIMTSNVGTSFEKKSIGFVENKNDFKNTIQKSFEENFSKEFINRIDEVVIFNSLSSDNLLNVLELAINDLMVRVKHLKLNIDIKDEVKNFLLKQSDFEKYGARQFKKVVLRHLENLISSEIINGKIQINDNLKIVLNLDELKIEKY